jgi:hypothetical protein
LSLMMVRSATAIIGEGRVLGKRYRAQKRMNLKSLKLKADAEMSKSPNPNARSKRMLLSRSPITKRRRKLRASQAGLKELLKKPRRKKSRCNLL